MSTPAACAVIVVSWRRPGWLDRCLRSLASQPACEVIVVADPDTARDMRPPPLPMPCRSLVVTQRNVSAARNRGWTATDAPLVAFMDDDAEAEPGWLAGLTAPFARSDVATATGFVRAGAGPGWQFRGERITREAVIHGLDIPGDRVCLLPPPEDGAIVTIGTNCAFRVADLAGLGGFDEGLRYFLDESDLNLRLAPSGRLTAVAPKAIVRHHRAAGPYRNAAGRLVDHTEIGASLARVISRHAPPDRGPRALRAALDRQVATGLRAMVRGDCEPGDILRMRRQLLTGVHRKKAGTHPDAPAFYGKRYDAGWPHCKSETEGG